MIGVAGVVEIAFQCFDVLAWPLLAWVYPICCSVRAIEANSISDTQKLNAYWAVFSLSLFFEHAFLKLLEWLPLWPYIRIIIVFWLSIPHFDGAFYVYKHLIRPCLTMDPQSVINWFNNRRKESLFIEENVPAEVDRYAKENGPEALERIVSCKVGQAEPNLTGTGKCKLAAMENKEKGIEVAADKEIPKTPPLKKVHKEWTCAISQLRTQSDTTFNSYLDGQNLKAAYEALIIKNQAEPNLTQIENRTSMVAEVKLNRVEVRTGREVFESSKMVQKEWTLISELEGKKYKAAYEALEADLVYVHKLSQESTVKESDQLVYVHKLAQESTVKESDQPSDAGKSIPSSGSKQKGIINEKGQKNTIPTSISKNSDKSKDEPTESVSSNGLTRNTVKNLKEMVQGEQQNPNEVPRMKDPHVFCKVCNVRCPEIDMASHLNGRKHQQNANEAQRKNGPPLWCKICNVHCSEIDMASHLNGRKHKENLQEQQESANEAQRKNGLPLWCKICNVRCSEIDMASHLNGRKHKENVQEQQENANEAQRKNGLLQWCKICNVCCSEINMASHLNGRKHKEKVQEQQQNEKEAQRKNGPPLWCKICSMGCSGLITLESHLNGRKHEKKQQNAKRKNDPHLWCKICNVGCSGLTTLTSHLNGRMHKENVQEHQHNTNEV